MNQTNKFRLPPWGEDHGYENKPNSLTPHILANEVNSTVQALIVQDPVGKTMGHDLGNNTQERDIM